MTLFLLGVISIIVGLAVTLIGFILESLFDLFIGDTLIKIGLMMMTIPFILGLLVGAFILLLALFGFAVLM